MNYMFQAMIIFGFSLMGEILHAIIPAPIPASVYGLVLLFLALLTKLVKLEQVETTAEYMISIMPLFFIEPTVGLMESFGIARGKVIPLVLTSAVSFIMVMIVTGLTAQFMIRKKKSNKKEGQSNG
ncbi:MAG: CidA/LrgA family protein [Lachnospiraceae bacterium]|nr:CidA/LrgA family protein [Lachnospiraceae bacterium]